MGYECTIEITHIFGSQMINQSSSETKGRYAHRDGLTSGLGSLHETLDEAHLQQSQARHGGILPVDGSLLERIERLENGLVVL